MMCLKLWHFDRPSSLKHIKPPKLKLPPPTEGGGDEGAQYIDIIPVDLLDKICSSYTNAPG